MSETSDQKATSAQDRLRKALARDDEEAGRIPAAPLEIDAEFLCEYCGEKNIITLDTTAGSRQDFTQDCDSCCSPNHIKASIDEDGNAELEVERGHD
jgi:hypothetical protein